MEKIVVIDLWNETENITIEEIDGEEFTIVEDKRIMRWKPWEPWMPWMPWKDGKTPSKTAIKSLIEEVMPHVLEKEEIECIIDEKIAPLPTKEDVLAMLDEKSKEMVWDSFEIERRPWWLLIKANWKEYFIERMVGSRWIPATWWGIWGDINAQEDFISTMLAFSIAL